MRIGVPAGFLAATMAVTCARAADPIDLFIRSPGATGDPVMAAKMFAWCSARYDYAAIIERNLPGIYPERLRTHQERALGARAAGAYRLYVAGAASVENGATVDEATDRDFIYYLNVVEGMTENDSDDIDLQFLLATPDENAETLTRLRGEFLRCIRETTDWQITQVNRMTPEQIAEAKKRRSFGPKLEARAGSPRPDGE